MDESRHAGADGDGRKSGRQCPLCLTWIQRTQDGTIADGMALHYQAIHPGEQVPRA